MKIVHFCLSCFYIDKFSYQENELVAQNVLDGHDVFVVASTETLDSKNNISHLNPSEYMGDDGAWVIRLPYRGFLPRKLMNKLRIHPGVYSILMKISPDVIMFHGICGWELITIAHYKNKNPAVKIYVDSHTDFKNSATTFVSKYFLHYIYYRTIIKFCLKYFEKVLCVSRSVIEFSENFYGIPPNKLEFYPLGGKVLDDEEYFRKRESVRFEYGIDSDDLLFIQSGKFDNKKKLIDSLVSFAKNNSKKCKFLIVGYLTDEVKNAVNKLIENDSRVTFLGWKSSDQLRDLLCAADFYIQPGSQSATMQMSICCRCVVILDDVSSHEPYVDGNGWLIGKMINLDDAIFEACSLSRERISEMSSRSSEIAFRMLDYRLLANRIYN